MCIRDSFKIDRMPQLFCKLRFLLCFAIVNAMSKTRRINTPHEINFFRARERKTKTIFQRCTLQKRCKVCQFCVCVFEFLCFLYGPLFFPSVTLQNWSNASANSLGFENWCFALCFTIVNAMCTFSFFQELRFCLRKTSFFDNCARSEFTCFQRCTLQKRCKVWQFTFYFLLFSLFHCVQIFVPSASLQNWLNVSAIV